VNNGSQDPIYRLPFEVSAPMLGPGGKRVAFTANGDVFPLPAKPCEVYVVDLRGGLMLGDAQAVITGQLSKRSTVSTVAWNDVNDLKVSGTTVDVFGGETPYSKSLPVPGVAGK
jgi:hypothetical protein